MKILSFMVSLCLLLSSSVSLGNDSKQDLAIQDGLYAYHKLQENQSVKSVIVIIDFSKSSNQDRLYVIDTQTNRTLMSLKVAHGIGSGKGTKAIKFSNNLNSHMTSLGVYLTSSVHLGKHGKSLRVIGLESSNNNAYKRMILVHGADYVTATKVGHSFGCFAVSQQIASKLVDLLGSDTMIFAYYSDPSYFLHSIYFH